MECGGRVPLRDSDTALASCSSTASTATWGVLVTLSPTPAKKHKKSGEWSRGGWKVRGQGSEVDNGESRERRGRFVVMRFSAAGAPRRQVPKPAAMRASMGRCRSGLEPCNVVWPPR